MDTDNTITTTMSPEVLRAQMVEKIRKVGHAHRAEVARVLRDTPHHEFVPDADVAVVYDPWHAVVTHRFADGRALSCASAPWVVAAMLDQLEARQFADS
jgi:protein-L-isoaspartate(D-aspartate) O-methyltransferase